MTPPLTLPGTLPGVREAAEAMARELYAAVVAQRPEGDTRPFDALPVTWQHAEIAAQLALLCDLTRPASVDWWARWLAHRVGMTVGATAPRWSRHPIYTDGPPRYYWSIGGEHGKAFHDHDGIYWRMDYDPVRVPGINDVTDPRAALRLACLHVAKAAADLDAAG